MTEHIVTLADGQEQAITDELLTEPELAHDVYKRLHSWSVGNAAKDKRRSGVENGSLSAPHGQGLPPRWYRAAAPGWTGRPRPCRPHGTDPGPQRWAIRPGWVDGDRVRQARSAAAYTCACAGRSQQAN
jgi:hypothetical protein